MLGTPTITDNGTTLTVCGTIAGLGNNQLVHIVVTGHATYTTQCSNNGGNIAPGQTKTVAVSASGTYQSGKNGRVNFCLTTTEPAPGTCPNSTWTGSVTDVEFSNITITANNKVVYQQ